MGVGRQHLFLSMRAVFEGSELGPLTEAFNCCPLHDPTRTDHIGLATEVHSTVT